jgi:predicted protein tyrosine phosphatase
MRVLFICNQNQNRSKTAEELFRPLFETKSAGLYNSTPVTSEQISWADLILVMEDSQRTELSKRFPKLYLQKHILSLNIPDYYQYKQPELVKILDELVTPLLQEVSVN